MVGAVVVLVASRASLSRAGVLEERSNAPLLATVRAVLVVVMVSRAAVPVLVLRGWLLVPPPPPWGW